MDGGGDQEARGSQDDSGWWLMVVHDGAWCFNDGEWELRGHVTWVVNGWERGFGSHCRERAQLGLRHSIIRSLVYHH